MTETNSIMLPVAVTDSKILSRTAKISVSSLIAAGPLLNGPIQMGATMVYWAIAWIALVLASLDVLKGKEKKRISILAIPFVVGLAYVLIRHFTTPIEYIARWDTSIFLIGTYLLSLLGMKRDSQINRIILLAFLAVTAMLAALCVGQQIYRENKIIPTLFGWEKAPPGYFHRFGATYFNPNHFAGVIGLAFPLAILGCFWRPGSRKWLYPCLIVLTAAEVATGSRGGFMALSVGVVALITLGLIKRSTRRHAIIAGVLIISTVFTSFYLQRKRGDSTSERLVDVQRAKGEAQSARKEYWMGGYKLWKEHAQSIAFGIGPSMYSRRFTEVQPVYLQQDPIRTHNDYLNIMFEYGLVGIALVSCSFILLVLGLCRINWGKLEPADKWMAGSVLAGILCFAIHATVEFNFYVLGTGVILFAYGGIACCYLSSREIEIPKWAARLSFGLILACCYVIFTMSLGVYYHEKGIKTKYADRAIDAFKKEYASNPSNGDAALQVALLLNQYARGQSDLQESDRYCEAAIKCKPYDFRAMMLQALLRVNGDRARGNILAWISTDNHCPKPRLI